MTIGAATGWEHLTGFNSRTGRYARGNTHLSSTFGMFISLEALISNMDTPSKALVESPDLHHLNCWIMFTRGIRSTRTGVSTINDGFQLEVVGLLLPKLKSTQTPSDRYVQCQFGANDRRLLLISGSGRPRSLT